MTKLRITKLEIENFRSIQSKVTLDIKPGLFGIVGVNNDEPSSTNGAGKSTLVSALYWCLTGNTLTNEVLADEIINNKVGKNCKVTVYINSNTDEIKITRTRKDSEFGNNLLLQINNEDLTCHKIADTQDRINKIIKIPFDLLHSTIMMTADIKSAFSQLTPQQRIHTLESIRDYTIWDKIRDEANKDIKIYNKEIQEGKLKLSEYLGSLKTYNELIKNQEQSLNEKIVSFNISDIELKIKEFNAEKRTLESKYEKTIQEKENLEKITKDVTGKVDTYKANLNDIVEKANLLKLEIKKIEFENDKLSNDILIIDNWFKNDKCPTCGKTLERTQENINAKTNEKIVLQNKINDISLKKDNINKELIAKRKEWQEINQLLQKIESTNVENMNKLTLFTKESSEYKDKIYFLDKEVSNLLILKENHEKIINDIKENVIVNKTKTEELLSKIEVLKQEIEILENKRQLSDYYYKLLGSKGELRPYLLNKDIIYLNKCMQKYITRFFENTTVELKLNGASIDILINSNGIDKAVSSLSGGEKKRLDLSIQLGLYDLVQSCSQLSFNLIWLDEIEQYLDDLGVNQLIEIIEDKSHEIESVYWISNNSTVKQEILNKIVCIKSLGKTIIEET